MVTPAGVQYPIVYCSLRVGAHPADSGWETPGRAPGVSVTGVIVNPDGTAQPVGPVALGFAEVFPLDYGMTAKRLEQTVLAWLHDSYGVDVTGMDCVFLPAGI